MAIYELNTDFDRIPVHLFAGDQLQLNIQIPYTVSLEADDLLIIRPRLVKRPAVVETPWHQKLKRAIGKHLRNENR